MSNSPYDNSTGYRTGLPVIQIQTSTISLQEEMQQASINNAYSEDETMPFQVPTAAVNYAETNAEGEYGEQETMPFQTYPPVVNITDIPPADEAAGQNFAPSFAVNAEAATGFEQVAAGYDEQPPFIPSNFDNEPPGTAETTGYAHIRKIAINNITNDEQQQPGYGYPIPAETTGYARVEQIDLNQQPDYQGTNGYTPEAAPGSYMPPIEPIPLNRDADFTAGHAYEPPAEVADYAQQVGHLNLYPQPTLPAGGAYAPAAETTGYTKVEQIDLNRQPDYLAGNGHAPAAPAPNYPPTQATTARQAVPISMFNLQQQAVQAPPQQMPNLPPLPPLPPMPAMPPVPPVPAQPAPPAAVHTAIATHPLGWLVAISGPMVGHAFPITQQLTRIGSAAEMEIALVQDSEVDAEQLHLLYSAEQRSFSLMQAPVGKQITTLSNGNIIHFQPTDIGHGEMLNVSRHTVLRFIPFCDNTFSWA